VAGKKRSEKSGRFTLRLHPELHAELASLAPWLGTDLNGLINILILESLPRYRAMAVRKEFRETVPVLPDPPRELVRLAVEAGRGKEGVEERINAMIAAVKDKLKRDDPVVGTTLVAAVHELQKEDEVQAMRDAIKRFNEGEM
jgi:hypothetical protein